MLFRISEPLAYTLLSSSEMVTEPFPVILQVTLHVGIFENTAHIVILSEIAFTVYMFSASSSIFSSSFTRNDVNSYPSFTVTLKVSFDPRIISEPNAVASSASLTNISTLPPVAVVLVTITLLENTTVTSVSSSMTKVVPLFTSPFTNTCDNTYPSSGSAMTVNALNWSTSPLVTSSFLALTTLNVPPSVG